MKALAVLLLLLTLPGAARAELAVEARGSATVTGGDLAAAKNRALDDAFRQAVDQAIGRLVEPAAREAGADVIKKRILRRARSYVVRYRVLSEGEAEGVYAITVDAAVADTRLGADLAAIGVGPAGATPEPTTDAPAPRPAGRPSLAVLAVSTDGTSQWASFGRAGGDGGPVAQALERELGSRGFKIAPGSGIDVPVTVEGAAGLPLDVGQSQSIARAAGAGGALVAAARIADGGRVRGTRQVGAEVELAVRLDDAQTGTLGAAQVTAAGFGDDLAAASASAARQAAVRAGRALAPRLESHWPEPGAGASAGGVLVHLRGVARAADVDAVAKGLAALPGVKQVVAQRFARREVTLVVRGGPGPRALADAVTRSPPEGTLARASATAGEVDVQLSVDTTLPPPPITPPR